MSEEDYITVERYLSNDLDAQEREIFLGKVTADVALAKYLSQAQEQEEYLEQVQKKQDILEQVTAIHQTYSKKDISHSEEQQVVPGGRKRRLYLMAAAATILLLVYALVTWSNGAEQSIIEHRPLAAEMGAVGESATARRAFNEGKYEEALPLLEKVIASSPEANADWLRALGICLIELKKHEEALKVFDQLATRSPIHKEVCLFYKGLIMYRLGDVEGAKENLNKVSDDAYYKQAAQKILKKITRKG